MYGMNNSVKLFDNKLTNWLMDLAGLKQSQSKMSIYYKYALYWSKLVSLYYVDDCVFWYTYDECGKWFVDKLGKIFHMNFLGYAQ